MSLCFVPTPAEVALEGQRIEGIWLQHTIRPHGAEVGGRAAAQVGAGSSIARFALVLFIVTRSLRPRFGHDRRVSALQSQVQRHHLRSCPGADTRPSDLHIQIILKQIVK